MSSATAAATRQTVDLVDSFIEGDAPRATGRFGVLTLRSSFQPIFSVAHGSVVGHEALVRAVDRAGMELAPQDLFDLATDPYDAVLLDRLCRTVHLRNHLAQRADDGWIFLNVNPQVIVEGRRYGAFFRELLEGCGVPPHRIVIEVLESALFAEARLAEAVSYYRRLGCLLAIDDFGAGYSNFDRIWRLKPEIVKLDRSVIVRAAEDLSVRLIMPRMASLLHEAGSLVLVEGIETEQQAMIALEADVDFMQGHLFARPHPDLTPRDAAAPLFEKLFRQFGRINELERAAYRSDIAPYLHGLRQAADGLRGGTPLADACAPFLSLPSAERCYVLDAAGRQSAPPVGSGREAPVDPRFAPVSDSTGANWSRRHYFRRAIAQPEMVHVTRPYLSLANALSCVTVSIAVPTAAGLHVLCGDVAWNERFSASDRTIDTHRADRV